MFTYIFEPGHAPRLFNEQSTAFHVGAKITGSRFSKTVSDAKQPAPAVIPKDKRQSPDKVIRDQTSTEQAIVYRLTADYNPLHIGTFIHLA